MGVGAGPVVSVIVPCFNAAPYIDEALESLRNQTLSDIEILVIDDASTDDSVARIRRHAVDDPRVKLMTSERASGSASAPRNRGLAAASGEYVAFLDADDIALPHRLERTIHAMRAHDAPVAFADFAQFRDGEREQQERGFLDRSDYLARGASCYRSAGDGVWLTDDSIVGFMLRDMMGMNVQTFVAARSAITALDGHFDEGLVGGEDLELFLRLASANKVAYVAEVLTRMRISGTSLTARRYLQCASDSASVKYKFMLEWRSRLQEPQLAKIRDALALHYLDIGIRYRQRGDGATARSFYKRSWRLRRGVRVAVEYAKTFVVGALGTSAQEK